MPNTKSAKKALRVSTRKRSFNLVTKGKIKKALKDLRVGVKNESKNIQELLGKVYSSIDKAVKKNLIPKKRAARKKSRLNKMLKEKAPFKVKKLTKDKPTKVTKTEPKTTKAKKKPVTKTVSKAPKPKKTAKS